MITIAGTANTANTTDTMTIVNIEPHDIIDTITPWYPGAPEEITQAIADLQEAVLTGQPTDALTAYLDISILH